MRPLFPSLGAGILAVGVAAAQVAGDSGGGNAPQLPVGQTFKQFEFPVYQDGKLRYTLNAIEARGITLNRAEATNLKIEVYDNGAITTTITSPKADLYVNEQKMRTKNTVLIERSDMEATSQDCDFDVKTKKYLLRTNVKVVLKHFDISMNPAPAAGSTKPGTTTGTTPAPVPAPSSTPAPVPAPSATPAPVRNDSLLTSPGSYSDTNSAPIPPSSPDSK